MSRQLKFDYLNLYLLVSVDCTSMDRSVQEEFLHGVSGPDPPDEVYDEILDKLKEDLTHHEGLRELNAQRRKLEMESALSNQEETTDFFQELLKSDPGLADLLSGGDRLVTSTGPGESAPFVGKQFPTYFQIDKEPKGGLVKSCAVNRTCRIEFETDATNDYFNRATCPGTIRIEPPNLLEHSHLWNGVFFDPVPHPVGRGPRRRRRRDGHGRGREDRDQGGAASSRGSRSRPRRRSTRPTPRGAARRTRSASRIGTGSNLVRRLTPPIPHEVRKEAWDTRTPSFDEFTAIQVCNDGSGGYDFYINMDNAYLLTELSQDKDTDRPLVKFWFKYGLMLCAMGMLQDERRREANRHAPRASGRPPDGGGLDPINRYCTAWQGLSSPSFGGCIGDPRPSPARRRRPMDQEHLGRGISARLALRVPLPIRDSPPGETGRNRRFGCRSGDNQHPTCAEIGGQLGSRFGEPQELYDVGVRVQERA